MVFWDYKGEKGYGHVIEGMDDAAGRGEGEDDMGVGVGEGEKNGGGGEFPRYVLCGGWGFELISVGILLRRLLEIYWGWIRGNGESLGGWIMR